MVSDDMFNQNQTFSLKGRAHKLVLVVWKKGI